jgi:hypothetical protein
MPHRIIQPSKEQVRAYMAAREVARRPPPSPEEIRRQLGWHLESQPVPSLVQFYLIPTSYSHLATRIALDWMLAPVRQVLQRHHTR